MTEDPNSSADEMALFRRAVGQIKRMKQDTVLHTKSRPSIRAIKELKRTHCEEHCTFYFSDAYHPFLKEDPIRYKRDDVSSYEVKQLRRGDYEPELFSDLHGMTQAEAKRELSALLTACLNDRIACACIMYGHGKNILKKQVPRWLAQHPAVRCFHQATPEFGGSAALLLLLDVVKPED